MTEHPTAAAAADTRQEDLLDAVRRAWADVLEVDIAPLDTNFFEAGGDSLLLIILLEQINDLTARDFEAADLFEHSTVRAQASLLVAPDAEAERSALGANDRVRLLGRAAR
ncbi:MAG: hypothetical protein QOG94_2760 [Solirubrobacteraceae bacterium]|jgi:aryl carrier-like protein|nr:hypothetical protein [Solirubrobacteraceae bacterium]